MVLGVAVAGRQKTVNFPHKLEYKEMFYHLTHRKDMHVSFNLKKKMFHSIFYYDPIKFPIHSGKK